MFPAGEAVSGRPGAQPPGEPAAQAGGGTGQAAERGHLGGVDFRAVSLWELSRAPASSTRAAAGVCGLAARACHTKGYGVRAVPGRAGEGEVVGGGGHGEPPGAGPAESSSWRRGRAG